MNFIDIIIFIVIFIVLYVLLLNFFYAIFVLLYIFDMNLKIVPEYIGDPVGRLLFFLMYFLLPFFWICFLFLVIMYIIYWIIVHIIPEFFLMIPIRAMLLALPPFPALMRSGIFDLFDFLLSKIGSQESIDSLAASITYNLTLFAIRGTSFILKGIFPGYDDQYFVDLINEKKDSKEILYSLKELANSDSNTTNTTNTTSTTNINYSDSDDSNANSNRRNDTSDNYKIEKTQKDILMNKYEEQCKLANGNSGGMNSYCKLQNHILDMLISKIDNKEIL
jgi:hypothetical protein